MPENRPSGRSARVRALLTDHEVELLRKLAKEGMPYRVLAEKLECSRWSIDRICRHERRNQIIVGFKEVGQ